MDKLLVEHVAKAIADSTYQKLQEYPDGSYLSRCIDTEMATKAAMAAIEAINSYKDSDYAAVHNSPDVVRPAAAPDNATQNTGEK